MRYAERGAHRKSIVSPSPLCERERVKEQRKKVEKEEKEVEKRYIKKKEESGIREKKH